MTRTLSKGPQTAVCQSETVCLLTTRRAQEEAEVIPAGIGPTELHALPKPNDVLSVQATDTAAAPAIRTLDTAAATVTQDRSIQDV